MPLTCVLTTRSLRSRIFSRLKLTAPDTSMPKLAACRTCSSLSAVATSVLVGMQPQFRQVPPTSAASMTVTCAPCWAARIAAT